MGKGLKIMIYDSSDTKENVLVHSTPQELNFVDDFITKNDLDISRTEIWRTGGWLYRNIPGRWRMDYTAGFDNWKDALTWVSEVGNGELIDEIEYWGHGSPGKVWMKNEVLHSRSFSEFSNWGPLLQKVRGRLHADSLVWFRTCSTFCGEPGHKFAKAWANNLGCTVAAHTHIIHILQAGLHTIKPGEEPSWDIKEGIKSGSTLRPIRIKWSNFNSPNCLFALQSDIPKGW